jgi:hypothetical protein
MAALLQRKYPFELNGNPDFIQYFVASRHPREFNETVIRFLVDERTGTS